MSKEGVLSVNTSGAPVIETLSGENGPHTPPNGHNFNFSGSVAGGSAANGAIEFITPGGPGAATDGQMDAVVRTDNVTIHINASNDLEVIGGSFVEEFNVDASTPPGTNPVVPTVGGDITVTGGQVAAGAVGTNVIRTNSLAANTYTIEIQRTQAVGSSTIADNGVCHFDSAAFNVDANGFVTFTGATGIQTIDGDTGSITGSTVTIYANQAASNCGATVNFVNSGTISTLNLTDSLFNIILGRLVNTPVLTGGGNVFLGTSICGNLSGNTNVGIGLNSGGNIDVGSDNTCAGHNSGVGLTAGSYGLYLGSGSGSQYINTDSSNISLLNQGVNGESNTIRIGTQGAGNGQQNKAFMAGIVGVTVANQEFVTINSATGQLGVTASAGGFAPCFLVAITGITGPVTGDGTSYDILFDTIVFDNNSNITLNSGGKTIFTAPATGIYEFSYTILVYGDAASPITSTSSAIGLLTTSSNYFSGYLNPSAMASTVGPYLTYTWTGIAAINIGDIASLNIGLGGGFLNVDLYGQAGGNYFTNWSGKQIA